MTTPRSRARRTLSRTVTSLGELVAAIFEAAQGSAELRARQTALVLSSPRLGRRLSRPIRIVP